MMVFGTVAAITLFILLIIFSFTQARLPCGGIEGKYVCKEDDPSIFLICVTGYEYEFHCPPGLHFNMRVSNCDWPEKSTCEFQGRVMVPPMNVPINRPASNDQPPAMYPSTTHRTTLPWRTRTRRTTRRPVQRTRPPTMPPQTRHLERRPQHKQLAQNGWATDTPGVKDDQRLTWTPSDPWAPITTTGLQRTTRYDGAPTVAPTEAPWHATTGWKEEEIQPRPVRPTPRTPQVAWREKKLEEQQKRFSKATTTVPTPTRPRKWWERRTTKRQFRTTTTERPQRAPIEQKLPPVSGECTAQKCPLPLCRCPGNDIPGGLPLKQVPQMVMLTFDDEVSVYNFPYFRKLFTKGRNNPNGCPIKGTFFVSGVASDFSKVRELYKRGHEIASHSKSHRFPHSWWASAGYEDFKDEIEGMRKELVKKAGIPYRDIKGMRVPFLQIGGDNQYKMLQDYGYMYDSSMLTGHLFRDKRPPLWPFTLDYPVDWKYSSLEPRPKKSYRGLWEVPLIRLYGNDARACSMADACTPTRTPQMALKYLRDNFLRHYTTNRAPLGIFVHARWFQREPYVLTAMEQFLEKLSQMDDVWVVSVSQVVEWTRNPTPISELNSFGPFQC